jgi:hypothetical protein
MRAKTTTIWRMIIPVMALGVGLFLFGCGGDDGGGGDGDEKVCIDNDGDGYGENCDKGTDCDDTDPYSWLDCLGWVELCNGSTCSATDGGISGTGYSSEEPSLAIDSHGNPYVAWQENVSGIWQIYLKKWDGSKWIELCDGDTCSGSGDGLSNNIGHSERPSLAIDSSDNPIIAWNDASSGSNEIYLLRWNASKWIGMGGSATGGGISNSGNGKNVSITLSDADTPFVAWADKSSGFRQMYLRYWGGSSWDELCDGSTCSGSGGGISNTSDSTGFNSPPALCLDNNSYPVIAWEDHTTYVSILLRKWDGVKWAELCEGSTCSGTGDGISPSSGMHYDPSMVLDISGNPIVAWHSSDWKLYLIYWDGVQWNGYGGSETGTGIPGFITSSLASISIDGNDYPIVAWTADPGPTIQIYLKRWDGLSWAEMGGSATGGGISDSTNIFATFPSLYLGPDGNPAVAWQDNSSTVKEIYFKKWKP